MGKSQGYAGVQRIKSIEEASGIMNLTHDLIACACLKYKIKILGGG
jgi:hypothetical protein